LVGQAEEVVEDLKDTAERLDRLGSAGKLPVSALLRHGPTAILGLLALMLLATVLLTILRPPSPIPLGSQLAMRAVGFVLVGICYVGLRPLAVLAREGLRLRGTIVDYEVRQSKNGTLLWPIVRIEDPPFAGRQFTSRTTFYLWFRFRHPPGSPHSVLAHPTREVFELNRLGRGNIALLVGAIAGVLSFLMPEMVAWLSR
jgi:hypothetical protein